METEKELTYADLTMIEKELLEKSVNQLPIFQEVFIQGESIGDGVQSESDWLGAYESAFNRIKARRKFMGENAFLFRKEKVEELRNLTGASLSYLRKLLDACDWDFFTALRVFKSLQHIGDDSPSSESVREVSG